MRSFKQVIMEASVVNWEADRPSPEPGTVSRTGGVRGIWEDGVPEMDGWVIACQSPGPRSRIPV